MEMSVNGYSSLWKAIIRPPKDDYSYEDLGPKRFLVNRRECKRTDVDIKNGRGFNLRCSHFEPADKTRPAKKLPCVIYLHGNCSSRVESLSTVRLLLSSNITLFSFDFSGCGQSEGEYISLGWYEREDLKTVIEYLRGTETVATIGLWGRSMGAVTALLYADRDPSIGGMLLDSPFSSLKLLAEELCRKHTKVPGFVLSMALKFVRKTIKNKASFDILELTPIKNVENCFIPALFGVADQDDFIDPHHGQDLYDKYSGDKNIIRFEGDHNSERPSFLYDSALIFFLNTLQVDAVVKEQLGEEVKVDRVESKGGAGEKEFQPSREESHNLVDNGLDFGADFLDLQPDAEEEDEEMKMAILESLRL